MKKDSINNIGVSVIIPMYNSEITIMKTITSVINQTHELIDIIVIDDCSSDDSFKIVSEIALLNKKIRLFKNDSNKGAYYSRNKGIKLAYYDFISFLDSDDFYDHFKIDNQLSFMIKNNFNFTYTSFYRCDSNFKIIKKINLPSFISRKYLYHNTVIATSTVMYNKKKFPNINFKNFYYDDFVFWLELLELEDAHCLNSPLTYYRISSNSLSGNKFKSAYKVFKMFIILENSIILGFLHFAIWVKNTTFKYLLKY